MSSNMFVWCSSGSSMPDPQQGPSLAQMRWDTRISRTGVPHFQGQQLVNAPHKVAPSSTTSVFMSRAEGS
jgi:hypothetical protein